MYGHLDHLSVGFDVAVAFSRIDRISVVLRSNQSFLLETVRLREGLIDQLRWSDCLSDVQARLLNRQTVTSGKSKLVSRNNNSDLLDIPRSCDETRRTDSFRCLRQSGQTLVAKVLDNGRG